MILFLLVGAAWALKCAPLSYDVVAATSPVPAGTTVEVQIGPWVGTGTAGPGGALQIEVSTDAYERGHWFLLFPLGCTVPAVHRLTASWGGTAVEARVRREERTTLVVRRWLLPQLAQRAIGRG